MNVDPNKLLSTDHSSRPRSNLDKLKCKQVQLDSTKFFNNDAVTEWNKFSPSVVKCDGV